jgi:hypothetical protein
MKRNPKNRNSVPQSKTTKDDLSEQELNKVTGGTGKAAADQGPKEVFSIPFSAMQVTYTQD